MGPSPQKTSYNPLQGSNLSSSQLQNTRFSPQSSSSIPFSQSSNYPGNFIGYQGSVVGANTGTNQNTTPTSSGGSSPSYSREDLAYIDAQLHLQQYYLIAVALAQPLEHQEFQLVLLEQ